MVVSVERTWQRILCEQRLIRGVLVAGLGLTLWLRWQRFPMRFSQISFAYAAYFQPWAEAVDRSPVYGWLTFVGLHPPLYSALVTLELASGGGLLGAHLLSALFSALGVVGLYRSSRLLQPSAGIGLVTALLAAVCVYGLHYGLEINNYPLLWGLSSWILYAALKVALYPSMQSNRLLVMLLVLGMYTHILAVALGFLVLSILLVSLVQRFGPSRRLAQSTELRWWVQSVGLVVLAGLPLLRPVLEKAGQGSTFQNESPGMLVLIQQVWRLASNRYGSQEVMLLFFGLLGLGCTRLWDTRLRNATRIRTGFMVIVPYLLLVGVILALQLHGVAAAHQLPYFLVALPGLLVLAGAALLRRGGGARFQPGTLAGTAVVCLIVAQVVYGQVEVYEAKQLETQWNQRDEARTLENVLKTAEVVWLIAPPQYEDDDKRASDPIYQSLGGGWGCRYWQDPLLKFEYVDYRFGQPMQCGDKIIFTFTDVYQYPMDKLLKYFIEKNMNVKVVLYNFEESPSLKYQLEKLLEGRHVAQQVDGKLVILRVIAS